ncbi:winged helix-turn-helix transcriptional regulator [Nitrospinae bacterium AH_259_B05_G02_I21]|nr:winged helix-turn-helix transcriptional regulator [Nitrospinae bacterium AH_259_B05_G02_I21]MDA2931923.1 winged helix-turn-helix transcriptional regulator [Nitrospinae bacterium AH-259-F20]
MEKDLLRTLQLLTEIESGVKLTQRSLAKKLGIALGLTNAYLKRFVHKGFVKIHRASANDIRYLLTPAGLMEKSRLTYEYLQHSFKYYSNARGQIATAFHTLRREGVSSLAFYGAGEVAEVAYISLHETDLSLAGVVDDHRAGESFFGFDILPSQRLKELDFDRVVVTSFRHEDEIIGKIKALGIPEEQVFRLS